MCTLTEVWFFCRRMMWSSMHPLSRTTECPREWTSFSLIQNANASSSLKCSSVSSVANKSRLWVEVSGQSESEPIKNRMRSWRLRTWTLRSIMGRIMQSWQWYCASALTPSLCLKMFIIPRLHLPRNDPRIFKKCFKKKTHKKLNTKTNAKVHTSADVM